MKYADPVLHCTEYRVQAFDVSVRSPGRNRILYSHGVGSVCATFLLHERKSNNIAFHISSLEKHPQITRRDRNNQTLDRPMTRAMVMELSSCLTIPKDFFFMSFGHLAVIHKHIVTTKMVNDNVADIFDLKWA